jgi:maltose O-acetyltransferase
MNMRIIGRVAKVLRWIRIGFYAGLSTGNVKGKTIKLQPVLILGNGIIEFERNVQLGYFPSPFFLNGYIHLEARGKNASIKFGENSFINNNFSAISEHKSITIGKRCLIGTNVEIYDSDFHGIKVSDRSISIYENAKEVVIGDDVFIGSNVKILKGSVIGSGSVIANGAIVTGEIPSNVIAGGNPAKVIKVIEQ